MISDIHGCIGTFNKLLERLSYRSDHDQLIMLGDYVDRGAHSKATVDRVMELVQTDGAIALRGNHDDRLAKLILDDHPSIRATFLEHGGIQTIRSYCGKSGDWDEVSQERELEQAIARIRTHYSDHLSFLSSLPFYYETDHFLCVHAGINPKAASWKEQSQHDFMYIKDPFIQSSFELGKPIVFGHTKTMDIHGSPDVWFSRDKIGIDGGCAYGMQLNALIYEEGTFSAVSLGVEEGDR
jgi:serine/threonine protein phosphatase 1